MMDVNVVGCMGCVNAVLPGVQQRRHGQVDVLFVSSMAGQVGIYGLGAYFASKFALHVRGLAESLRMECKPYEIVVPLAFPT